MATYSKNASRGAVSFTSLCLSYALLWLAWYTIFGNGCVPWNSMGPIIQLATLMVACAVLFWMIAIFLAGAARATNDGMIPALLTEVIAFAPIIFILGLMVWNIVFPETAISPSDVIPSTPSSNTEEPSNTIGSTC